MFPYKKEEAWLSGYGAGLVIQRPRVQVLTSLLAGITLSSPEIFGHQCNIANWFASYQLGFLTMLCSI